MKAILCGSCVDIRALDPEGDWVTCRCGNMSARWINPQAGTVEVRAKDKSSARMLGVNNVFLLAGIKGPTHEMMVQSGGQWEAWRDLHTIATHAPGYIFDKDKRACWACIVKVGETGDITWEPEKAP